MAMDFSLFYFFWNTQRGSTSIANLGYLMTFISGSQLSIEAVSFYLLAYFITTPTAFEIITLLSDRDSDAENMDSYTALFWRQSVLASIFTAALLSLAGIPLTAGFIGKFYILAAGLQGGYWIAALVMVISSVVGLYYYLRIITTMFSGYKGISLTENKLTRFFIYSVASLYRF